MPPVGFEPKISAGERPQTYAVDRAATGTGTKSIVTYVKLHNFVMIQMMFIETHYVRKNWIEEI
jgi:hypothetical protein